MPLLPKRRSTLDLLSEELRANRAERDISGRSDTPTERRASLPRPQSDHGLSSSPPPFGDPSASPDLGFPKPSKRFSMRLSRHFSDSALATRAKLQAQDEDRPPVPSLPAEPPPPAILTTAPTGDVQPEGKKKTRGNIFKRQKSSAGLLKTNTAEKAIQPAKEQGKSKFAWGRKSQDSRRTLEIQRLIAGDGTESQSSPRPKSPALASPSLQARKSGEYLSTDSPKTTKKSVFGIAKRDKRKSLFPLPVKIEPPPQYPDTAPATPRESTSNISQRSGGSPIYRDSPRKKYEGFGSEDLQRLHASSSQGALGRPNVTFAPPGYPLMRNDSNRSTPSTHSSPNMGPPRRLGIRDRASTNSTFGRPSEDITPPTPPTLNGSVRNSTSTGGRASLGNYLTLNRFRNADGGLKQDSSGLVSKSNSMQISRDVSLSLPERVDGETAAKYLERLQNQVSRNVIAGMLSKSVDPFFQNVLRSYTRRFAFFGEPIDMSLRKFLLEAELPKETQQVDRVIQAFADRYHECNPGIFLSPDEAYLIAFSLMMLHTDAFNKNNKYKMQKSDYIKNIRGQHVSEDVLACFYDNICYTPFIHFDEDDFDGSSDRLSTFKSKKAKLKGAMQDPTKKASGPVDPYYLIIENKLDALRPSIRESIVLDDPYNYLGTAKSLDQLKIQRAFHNTGTLQIISARSRPAAYVTEPNGDNPAESKPGVIDLQVTKVGILWRKSAKRKKARSPWQEWGAILTGSQLYFFKNVSWVKNLMQQYSTHQKHMVPPSPVVFKPPLEEFKPDSLIKTDDAVALVDATYNRHKNAFTLVRHGGEEETLLADNESELNEWLALINYSAAFRSAGVRIRGFVNVNAIESQPSPIKRTTSSRTVRPGEDGHRRTTSVSPLLAKQIMAARRQQMISKIAEAEIKITDTTKTLDEMLRNARHLLILAPIQPRTREVIIHSAAKMDAMLKWTRRDIWRTKCYKEILYMDALEDTDDIKAEAAKLRPISTYPAQEQQPEFETAAADPDDDEDEPDTAPASPAVGSRPQTTSSALGLPDEDIFRTPPESARTPQGENFAWKLPPLELNAAVAGAQFDRRQSVVSTVPSSVSGRRPSFTHSSSVASVQDMSRLSTAATPSDKPMSFTASNPITPASAHKRDPLHHSTTASTTASAVRRLSDAANHVQSTPDSGARTRSHRKSLHRTLRDGLHESGSIHRHRKGKESASTVKSDGVDRVEGEDVPEGTPGLERREGRFILHGKQASVITFGEGWDGTVMRMPTVARREEGKRSVADDEAPRALDGIEGVGAGVDAEDGSKGGGGDAVGLVLGRDESTAFSRHQSVTADALAAVAYADGLAPRGSVSSDGRSGSWFDAQSTDENGAVEGESEVTDEGSSRREEGAEGAKEVDGKVEAGEQEGRQQSTAGKVRPESATLGSLGVL